MLNIVLIEPEIPNNTGNIGRLALATNSKLHLVKPFGFELSDKRLKRAGLDYWQYLEVIIYDSVDAFFDINQNENFVLFSSHGAKSHWDIPFTDNMFLIFGKESVGLDKTLIRTHSNSLYKIPLYSEHIRSLNLANAVSIVIYEGLRQLK
ncbi:tRNA (cytidine(34)-2'-O)-methyltransferase [Olleya sp. YS]|uniref:tRNA (cytidine(34)-2'-O)-methyltransferase n=1 Tax=Olleya sp. YS TaxID=3028318 RepID=UPI0024341C50|nr:tRNA (cytidine(34)-2'-O)-methyltransferase [Olleya sp. YS]WGD35177.1 tRNA (cytidine(34)-2'-O)-methyltransferase [Olleya sp. YS]